MAAKSRNKYDVAVWVRSVIESCETMDQLTNACSLFANFKAMYPESENEALYRYINEGREHVRCVVGEIISSI